MNKLLIITVFLVSAPAHASIDGLNLIVISFTNSIPAITNVTWSESGEISVSTNGLGWDGDATGSRDFWIQSIPEPIGTSWRPAEGTTVTIEITPQIKPVTLSNGQTSTPYGGGSLCAIQPGQKALVLLAGSGAGERGGNKSSVSRFDPSPANRARTIRQTGFRILVLGCGLEK